MRKLCPKCRESKDTKEFDENRARGDGLSSYCHKCELKRYRRRRKTDEYLGYQREWVKKWRLTPRGILNRIRYSAKSREVPFNITAPEFEDWLSSRKLICFYCSIPFLTATGKTGGRKDKSMKYATIDRKDNRKGYTIDNITLCCARCNVIKGSWFTCKQMLEIGEKYLRGLTYAHEDIH